MENFDKYINLHMVRKITTGQSGAEVFELDHGRVAKHVSRNRLADPALWESYVRELRFYAAFAPKAHSFLPEIYHCLHSEDEIQLIMKKYSPLQRGGLDENLLEKVFTVLGAIHRLPPPDFLPRPSGKPLSLSGQKIEALLENWLSILKEHEPSFSQEDLYRAACNINEINRKFYSAKSWCCHGDFHFENLLAKDDGGLAACDWQSVNMGHVSGDISFFLSRLAADGFALSRERAIQAYCRCSGTDISSEEIRIQMSLANLNTSFIHWHHYLHHCSPKRVGDIFLAMTADADFLLGR